jgi:hypothetical protein
VLVVRGALQRLRTEVTEQPVDAAAYAAFTDSFAVRDDETGHADIIREQIDGVVVPTLVLTLAGAAADDFFRPYRPAPGTLLA